jgi:hypothetical protein
MLLKSAINFSIRNGLPAIAAAAALFLMSAGPASAAPPRHPAATLAQPQQSSAADSDHTLAAMQDELDRARTRLELTIPGTNQPARPYFIQYRVLDLDVRTIVAEFGALVSSTGGRNRIMSVDVRVGNDNLDSSNFITDEGFSGFLGSTGTVGIDRDYDSLRQDLWLASDQSFKAAVENFSKKQAFMSRLAKAPSIPDYSPATPTVLVDPLTDPDWTTRNWEQEARTVSAALRQFPQLYSSRVTYHLIYTTSYLINTDGSKIRANRSLAAIEASLETESDDGMALHNYYAVYRHRPVARGRCRSKGPRKSRGTIDHAACFSSRSRLRWPGAVRSARGRLLACANAGAVAFRRARAAGHAIGLRSIDGSLGRAQRVDRQARLPRPPRPGFAAG